MKSNIVKTYHTSLEATDNVADTLEWKVQTIMAENDGVATAEQVAEYLALSIGNLDRVQKFLEQSKKETDAKIKSVKAQLNLIKVEAAQYFINNGLIDPNSEKPKDRKIACEQWCNSVSISKEKLPETTTETREEFMMHISQDELEELLIGLGKGERVTVETEKTSNHIPAKIKVNQANALSVTVEETKAIA